MYLIFYIIRLLYLILSKSGTLSPPFFKGGIKTQGFYADSRSVKSYLTNQEDMSMGLKEYLSAGNLPAAKHSGFQTRFT
ncbi:MAG: hypothetical protein BWK80_13860, partial [Desulfobacteraceae bacterium IS3]